MDYFFGEGPEECSVQEQHEAAQTICFTCPVQLECLHYCIATETEYGVWGGLTESQRKRHLWPKIREHSATDEVLNSVILQVGERLKRIQRGSCVSG